MDSFLRWIRAIFADSKGEPSSKRTISIIAFLLLAIAFVVNLFTNKTVDEFMWDGMITLVIFGIGFVASEKFAGIFRRPGPKSPEKPIEPPYRGDDYTTKEGCNEDDESLMV